MPSPHILIYGINYYPEPIGIPRYTTEMAEDMAAKGYRVTVIAAAPLYPTWVRRPGYHYHRYSTEHRNGVTVHRVPTYVPGKPNFMQRIIYELMFCLMSLPLVLRYTLQGIDALVITTPPLVLCVALLMPLGRARKAVIVKDLQIDIAENLGIIRKPWLLGTLYRIERFLLGRADIVTAVSSGMLQRIKAKGLRHAQCEFFPDWVDVEKLQEVPAARIQAMRSALVLPHDKVIIGYSGNMARKQGLELLVEIAERFRQRTNVHFLICGDGPAKKSLENLVAEKRIANISFAPLQAEEDLAALLSAIDVHVVVQKDEVSDLVMPGKMFNIMSCNRPLVITAPVGSAIDKVIAASSAGFRIAREDVDGFEKALESLYLEPEVRADMGRNGRRFVVNNMSRRQILDTFYGRLFSSCSNHSLV